MTFPADLDPGIREYVMLLREVGIETFESCQGGPGHAYPVPTVAFEGEPSEGFRAFAKAKMHDLPVARLSRVWRTDYCELTGPWWELTFYAPADVPTESVRTAHSAEDPPARQPRSAVQCCSQPCTRCHRDRGPQDRQVWSATGLSSPQFLPSLLTVCRSLRRQLLSRLGTLP